MPSRKTYAFFRGGPAYDDEKGHSITPHIIMEYKIVGRKIKLVNTLSWYDYHKRKDKYYINGKPGTAKKYKAVSKSFGKTVTFYPNSSSKRRKLGVQ